MNVLAVNILWSLGLTCALLWRVSSLLKVLEERQPWAGFLQLTLVLTVFKQLMALFFYTADSASDAKLFYILLVLPTGFFFPVAFETVLRFVRRPSRRLAKLSAAGVVLTLFVVCSFGIEGMILRRPTGVGMMIFDARLAPWAGSLLVGWTVFYGIVTWLALRPVTAPASRPFLPVMYGYGINLLIIIHDSQVASGVLQTPFLSGFGNVILAVSLIISAERAVGLELRRISQSDLQAMAELESRQRFLDGISGELKAPLDEIDDLRKRLAAQPLDPDSARLLGLIDTSSSVLNGTLAELIDLEQLTRGEFTLGHAPIELGPLLSGVVAQGQDLAAADGLHFVAEIDVAEDLVVHGDGKRLRQILVSLIANAVKFTVEGQVLFRCRAYAAAESSRITLSFEVEDTGVGISANDQERVFAPFARAEEGLERRFEGVGLGLALCERLAELMGGRIQLNSALEQGTQVHVALSLDSMPGGQRSV